MNQLNKDIIDSFTGQNRWLSNFFPCSILFKNINFPTLEHAYQWEKVLDKKTKFLIKIAATPGLAKELANDQSAERCPNWELKKEAVMKELLFIKFQNEELRKKLLSTGDKYLIEGNTWKDTFWGVYRGKGYNRLGLLLMEVREQLKHEQ